MWDQAVEAAILCAALMFGAVALYAVAVGFMTLGGIPASRRRVEDGQATYDDAWRYAARHAKQRNLALSPEVSTRLSMNPPFVVEWLRAGEDWRLLETCYRAGFSDTELSAHLNGLQRITQEQADLLVALQSTTR